MKQIEDIRTVETTYVNKEENKVETKPEETKKETKKNTSKNITLNENFTFETFIPGEGSDFAYKAAQAVAEEPGVKYNPILFYGGVGLGKTHLMQAIGNKISELQNDSLKITYLQAESFANEYINSINSKTTEKFKSKYRNLDILFLVLLYIQRIHYIHCVYLIFFVLILDVF